MRLCRLRQGENALIGKPAVPGFIFDDLSNPASPVQTGHPIKHHALIHQCHRFADSPGDHIPHFTGLNQASNILPVHVGLSHSRESRQRAGGHGKTRLFQHGLHVFRRLSQQHQGSFIGKCLAHLPQGLQVSALDGFHQGKQPGHTHLNQQVKCLLGTQWYGGFEGRNAIHEQAVLLCFRKTFGQGQGITPTSQNDSGGVG
ncbi:MAG: hypothetical protein HC898_01905 [Phycisphaerales bacterium]|nr:hypothetical protein [Phycisphaerales bacterium]